MFASKQMIMYEYLKPIFKNNCEHCNGFLPFILNGSSIKDVACALISP